MTTKVNSDKANAGNVTGGGIDEARTEGEKVMCIGSGTFSVLRERRLINRGFTAWDKDNHTSLINGELTFAMERTQQLEQDTDFKQVIPYITLTRNREFFWYRRNSGLSDSGEGDHRLDGSISIGIGGHWRGAESFLECMLREYSEEIGSFSLRDVVHGESARHALTSLGGRVGSMFSSIFPVGMIWDESNAVGRVHLGVLLQVELSSMILPCKGSDLENHECGWSGLEDLQRTRGGDFEVWTKIVVERGLAL